MAEEMEQPAPSVFETGKAQARYAEGSEGEPVKRVINYPISYPVKATVGEWQDKMMVFDWDNPENTTLTLDATKLSIGALEIQHHDMFQCVVIYDDTLRPPGTILHVETKGEAYEVLLDKKIEIEEELGAPHQVEYREEQSESYMGMLTGVLLVAAAGAAIYWKYGDQLADFFKGAPTG